MKFEKSGGGLALISKKRGILGWVMKSTNGQYTYDVSRKQTKGKREFFETEDLAKSALMRLA